MADLRQLDIKYLPGVGPKRAETLAKEIGVRSFHDLLYYFPFRYIDRSTIHRIADIAGDMPYIQLRGRFLSFAEQGEGARRRLTALFGDGTGTIEVVWFNQVKFIKDKYSTGVDYIIFGKPTEFRNTYSIAHPEVDPYRPDEPPRGLQGIYSLTETMQRRAIGQRALQRLMANLVKTPAVRQMADTLPLDVTAPRHLMPLVEALTNIHCPASIAHLQAAQLRLKYEELFILQMHILKDVKGRTRRQRGLVFAHVGQLFNDFYSKGLRFPLTGAQKRVIREIRADMGSGRQMNRLLQGDVGSGKTIVAFLCALIALDNGYQACIMAPTEILATQHYESVSAMARVIGVKVALLTGNTRRRDRDTLHAALRDGSLQLLIGTHALLEDEVRFANLGLAVIDEQHRFGVAQRARLWSKNVIAPHVLVMTATPIPRTLAMTVYGDLDVSVIDELPPGRKPVTTIMRYDRQREQVYRFVGSELRQGRQVYVVYPLIEENEKLDLKALEQGYQTVTEAFPNYSVTFVHGRMKPADKDRQMALFASGKAQILVATTVIEVGVNVPNASVMVIENAERFGLSQLHQLRGRVGRGADKAYCILMTKQQLTRDTRHRLEVMTQTNDGFLVAEEDMRQRGPGDLEGTLQSGIAFNLKLADLAHDGQIIQMARDDAQQWLERDPELSSPAGRVIRQLVDDTFAHKVDWGMIS